LKNPCSSGEKAGEREERKNLFSLGKRRKKNKKRVKQNFA